MNQLIGAILMPSGIIALLIGLAVFLNFVIKQRKLAGYTIMAAALGYIFFGNSLTARWLMAPLEQEFMPAQDVQVPTSLDTLVVLTGYALADTDRPITGQVNSASGFRLMEAARIYTRTGRMTIIITGNGEVPNVMKDLLTQIGVRSIDIVTEQNSTNTHESAMQLRARLTGKHFYLVTSAGHMPRALRVFRKQGLFAIPASTDYLSPASLTDSSIIPSGRNLAISDLAVHEYLGLMWYRFLDRI